MLRENIPFMDANLASPCRFKRQAGEFWMSWDPYWTKSGPQMQRVFRKDGTVIGIPSHEPFWFQDSECRYVLCGCRSQQHMRQLANQQHNHRAGP